MRPMRAVAPPRPCVSREVEAGDEGVRGVPRHATGAAQCVLMGVPAIIKLLPNQQEQFCWKREESRLHVDPAKRGCDPRVMMRYHEILRFQRRMGETSGFWPPRTLRAVLGGVPQASLLCPLLQHIELPSTNSLPSECEWGGTLAMQLALRQDLKAARCMPEQPSVNG